MSQPWAISKELFTQVRTAITLNMRFTDMKLSDAPVSFETDGENLHCNPTWLLQRYRKEPQAVTRDYLHVLLHCVFRHPFVSTLAERRLWDLACDIAVEGWICGLNQPGFATGSDGRRRAVADSLRQQVAPLTAEKLYHRFQTHAPDPAWAALFQADDHEKWYKPPETQLMPWQAPSKDEDVWDLDDSEICGGERKAEAPDDRSSRSDNGGRDENNMELLGHMASVVSKALGQIMNPAVKASGDIASLLPEEERKRVVSLAEESLRLSRADWESFETSCGFRHHPLTPTPITDLTHHLFAELIEDGVPDVRLSYHFEYWQEACEMRFRQLKANEEELNRIFIELYGLRDQLTPEAEEKDAAAHKADLGRDIRSLVSFAVGCMMGRYAIDNYGVQYAGGDWQQWLALQEHAIWKPDEDGILPIMEGEYFSNDIAAMFEEWVKRTFGTLWLEVNLKYIAAALCPDGSGTARERIRQYFLNDFYQDHLEIYQDQPIYWLFDSGKENGFKCLVYVHRWTKDTVARIRTDYVHEMQLRYRTAAGELASRMDTVSGTERVRLQKQLVKIQAQEAEVAVYEKKLRHLADRMIDLDPDESVKHNYAIFQDILAEIR